MLRIWPEQPTALISATARMTPASPDGGFVTLLRPRRALGVLCRAAEGSCREDQDQLGRPIGRGSSGRPTPGC